MPLRRFRRSFFDIAVWAAVRLFVAVFLVVVRCTSQITESGDQDRPVQAFLINIGMGSTASRAMHSSICKLNLRSCHCLGCCVNGRNVNETVLRIHYSEQLRLFDNNDIAWTCLNAHDVNSRSKRCDAFSWRRSTEVLLQQYVALMGKKYYGLEDLPTEKIVDFVLQYASAKLQFKFVATTRTSAVWVQRRKQRYQHPNLICRYDSRPTWDNSVQRIKMNALGSYFDCIDAAAMHLNRTAGQFMHLKEVFTNNKEIDPERYVRIIEDYQTRYIYDVMRAHFERRKRNIDDNFLHVCYFNKSINFKELPQRQFRRVLNSYLATASTGEGD